MNVHMFTQIHILIIYRFKYAYHQGNKNPFTEKYTVDNYKQI